MSTLTRAPAPPEGDLLPSARTLGKGLAVLRIFLGLVLLGNGLAKVFGINRIDVGPYEAFLIDSPTARSIVRFEGFQNTAGGGPGTQVPGLFRSLQFVLDHWDVFGVLAAGLLLVSGTLLVLGLATRLGALLGLGFAVSLALLFASSNRWVFEQPHEYVPLLLLSIVPAGRVWGLDGALLRRRRTPLGGLRGWPS